MLKKGDRVIVYFSQTVAERQKNIQRVRCVATVIREGKRWATVDKQTFIGPDDNKVSVFNDPATEIEIAEALAKIKEAAEDRARENAEREAYQKREDVQLSQRLSSVQWEQYPVELLRKVAAILDEVA